MSARKGILSYAADLFNALGNRDTVKGINLAFNINYKCDQTRTNESNQQANENRDER